MVESIAAMGMNMQAAKVQQSMSIAMMKNTMQDQQVAVDGLIRMLSAATEGLGANLDTYA